MKRPYYLPCSGIQPVTGCTSSFNGLMRRVVLCCLLLCYGQCGGRTGKYLVERSVCRCVWPERVTVPYYSAGGETAQESRLRHSGSGSGHSIRLVRIIFLVGVVSAWTKRRYRFLSEVPRARDLLMGSFLRRDLTGRISCPGEFHRRR